MQARVDIPKGLPPLKGNPNWVELPLFDRKGWRTMAFGEFAESVNERVEPANAAEEIYVGLDDLDSGSLHIRRWGKGNDVIGTKLRFRKGDIIFGRRRAYQRKLAVAEMDGICSAHAMVVRPKSGVVLPEFLPFLMMSDRFMNRAVEISVGSLSPTINWTTLKHEPFTLPPLDQQRRIAEILWAVDEVVSALRNTEENLSEALDVLRDETIYGRQRSSEWSEKRIADITKLVTKGESPGWQGFKYGETGVRFITSENVHRDQLDVEPAKFIPEEFHKKLSRSSVESNDVLLTLVGGSLGRACIMPEGLGPSNVNQAVAVVRADYSQVLPEYILSSLQSPTGFSRLLAARVETFKANISLGTIREFQISVPPVAFQEQFCGRVSALKDTRLKVQSNLEVSNNLASELLNQIMEDSA